MMSKPPIDERRACQTKQLWYVNPITWKVIGLLLQLAMKVIDLFE
jgi:hypothetical protein